MCTMSAHEPGPRRDPILVSACLLGLPTRYNGAHCLRDNVLALTCEHTVIPACPEQLGGLPTPREPAEINQGNGVDVLDGRARVVDGLGTDVTAHYMRGAEAIARIAELLGARKAILKEGSPSCGVRRIRRAGADARGPGLAAALLQRKGVQVEGIE